LGTWTYDTKSKGIGKPAVITGPNGYKKELSYDALGRVNAVIMMCEPCTLRFINTNNFANDVFGGGFFMS
jgi:hypothetical protein